MSRIRRGAEEVLGILRRAPREVQALYFASGARHPEIAKLAKRADVRAQERGPEELDALASGRPHGGVLAIVGPYPYAELDEVLGAEAPLLVALDQITDPHNLGAIVRSAAAFGADGVLVLKDRAAPVNAVVVRASAGATERIPIVRVTNLARTLKDLARRDLSVVGLDARGEHPVDGLPEAPFGRALVVGAEGRGLRRLVRERCQLLARVPMVGDTESLNASVAASIALFAMTR